jgi:hypothetical protein
MNRTKGRSRIESSILVKLSSDSVFWALRLPSVAHSLLQRLPLSPQPHHRSTKFLCCRPKRSPAMTRLLIADDSPPIRRGLRRLLELNSDWQVCGGAVDGADAVEKAPCPRPYIDGLHDAADGWCPSSPENRRISYRHSDSAVHSQSFTSDYGIGTQRRSCVVLFQSRKSARYPMRSRRFSAVRLSSWRAKWGLLSQ